MPGNAKSGKDRIKIAICSCGEHLERKTLKGLWRWQDAHVERGHQVKIQK